MAGGRGRNHERLPSRDTEQRSGSELSGQTEGFPCDRGPRELRASRLKTPLSSAAAWPPSQASSQPLLSSRPRAGRARIYSQTGPGGRNPGNMPAAGLSLREKSLVPPQPGARATPAKLPTLFLHDRPRRNPVGQWLCFLLNQSAPGLLPHPSLWATSASRSNPTSAGGG